MSVEDVRCQEVVGVLTDFLEGAMPAAERILLEQHLAMCEGCMNYLDQLRTTIHLVGGLDTDAVPPAAVADLLDEFKAWKAQ